MANDKQFNIARANLAHSQAMLDKMHTPVAQEQPQETAQPSPQMASQPIVESQQPTPQAAPEPTSKPPVPAADSLEAEANSVKELDSTLASGFEAVSKLADAMKEVTGVKKSITKRIREKLNGEQKSKETVA